MKLVDLTHTFTIHTPGWVGYPSAVLSYFQRHATNGIVSQKLDLPLHSGTHFDSEMHIISGGKDMASIPLTTLCREGVIVDLTDVCEDWTVITPEMIEERVEVREGDILLYNTGYHKYYNGGPEEDEERYFLRHPGGDRRMAEWIVEKKLAWTGFDTGSGDHPMNTTIRYKRPDATKAFEAQMGKDVNEIFPEDDIFVMHRVPFRQGITHLENLGGDLDQVSNVRCMIGAFPIPIEGGEASPCRVVAFLDD